MGYMATFREWLSKQVDADNPIGDLARAAIADEDWTGSDPHSLDDRLSDERYSMETYIAFEVASEEYLFHHCPCYIWKDHDENEIHYHFKGKHYVGRLPIKWKHGGQWYYEEGQDSHGSYLNARTFTFETPDGDIKVRYVEIESRDWEFYEMVYPT